MPRQRLPPQATSEWTASARLRLAKVVNAHDYTLEAEELSSQSDGQIHAKLWKLKTGKEWTIPAIEMTKGNTTPIMTSIIVADGGRVSAMDLVEKLLDRGHRVVAVDPFYIGESKIPSRDFLFALLVGAVGERPVGIQASQLAAVARWAKRIYESSAVQLVANGERVCLSALIAVALEPNAVDAAELQGSSASLKQVVERNYAVNEKPEFFCFGLLEAFDIREISGLVAPREVRFIGASDRMRSELAPLKTWYADLGKDHDPLR